MLIPALEACPEKGVDTSSGGKPEVTKDAWVTTVCPGASAQVHYPTDHGGGDNADKGVERKLHKGESIVTEVSGPGDA